jgi:dihydroorotate dehydrogenase
MPQPPTSAPRESSSLESLVPVINPRTLGDWFLDVFKTIVPSAETRHHWLSPYAKTANFLRPGYKPDPSLEVTLRFHDRSLPIALASPIILAAGGNKTGRNLPDFASLGFGGVSVGSATPTPWEGNPFRPRVQLIPADDAMQNSMGLNNPGIDAIAAAVDRDLGRCHRRRMALGISVADTPGGNPDPDAWIDEIAGAFRKAYHAADYVELNVSCPNTGHQRLDDDAEWLRGLLSRIMSIRKSLAVRKAVFVKLSPDLSAPALDATLQVIEETGVTGLVLFNTFPAGKSKYLKLKTPPESLKPLRLDGGLGGLSGRPLYQNTLPAIRYIRKRCPHLALMAVGGIDHGAKVLELLEAGADVVQCYTVLAYRWMAIRRMNKELQEAMRMRGISHLDTLRGSPGDAI